MRVPDWLSRLSPVLALLIGLGLGAGLLMHIGVVRVFDLFAQARWWMAGVLPVRLAQFALTGVAWRIVSLRGAPPPRVYFFARWLREGVNSLLPVLPVAGLLAAVRVLVRRGLQLPRSVAATLADAGVELLAQIPFTVLGLALLAAGQGRGAVNVWMLAGLGVLCACGAALVPAQRLGLARFMERRAQGLGFAGRIDGLDAALAGIQHARRPLATAGLCHLAAWLIGGAEVWLVLSALAHQVGAAASLVIESLALALRTAAFLVPGALGVQEGGYILVCGLFGVPPAVALALSLAKRLRDVLFGVPSIAMWWRLERRADAIPVPAAPHGALPWPRPGAHSG